MLDPPSCPHAQQHVVNQPRLSSVDCLLGTPTPSLSHLHTYGSDLSLSQISVKHKFSNSDDVGKEAAAWCYAHKG